jgi:5-methyltetrahydrofolate--homocysteine methyltransferase
MSVKVVTIVGESINTSRPTVETMVGNRDASGIQSLAKAQADAGAAYLDINCGTRSADEVESMRWLVNTVQELVEIPLCIDSPEPEPLAAGLELARFGKPLMNSITGESQVFQKILPVVEKFDTKVIALCIDDTGIPLKAEDRFKVAERLIKDLRAAGVKDDDIYIDPLIQPVSANDQAGAEVLKVLRMITDAYPEVHKICGLSNISYGSPNRKLLNRLFTVLAMGSGMDAFVLNPKDKAMMGAVKAAETLIGSDPYCMRYLKAFKSGLYD